MIQLSHSFVRSLIDSFSFQYCDGGDLNELIQRSAPMGEEQIASLVDQLASALHYLHERNIVHRDLKPQNILLCLGADRERINLKLADFGFARHLLTEDMAATFCGSPLYMAPEVSSKEKIRKKGKKGGKKKEERGRRDEVIDSRKSLAQTFPPPFHVFFLFFFCSINTRFWRAASMMPRLTCGVWASSCSSASLATARFVLARSRS